MFLFRSLAACQPPFKTLMPHCERDIYVSRREEHLPAADEPGHACAAAVIPITGRRCRYCPAYQCLPSRCWFISDDTPLSRPCRHYSSAASRLKRRFLAIIHGRAAISPDIGYRCCYLHFHSPTSFAGRYRATLAFGASPPARYSCGARFGQRIAPRQSSRRRCRWRLRLMRGSADYFSA